MSRIRHLLTLAVVIATPVLAWATPVTTPVTHTFTPSPGDLYDLDHGWYYTWGIDLDLAAGESVTAATLTFNDIRNWDNNANVLYVHLLDTVPAGVQRGRDNQGGGNYFVNVYADVQSHLVTYQNLTTTPQDLVYEFDAADLAALNGYLADDRFGLGFDPDCHFYNNGVSLAVTVIPEPASLLLTLLGGLGLYLRRGR